MTMVGNEDFIDMINVVIKQIEKKRELPENCMFIRKNTSKKGNISWSICIHEPYYPAPYGDDKYDKCITSIVTFSKKIIIKVGDCIVFNVNEVGLEKIEVPGLPKILSGSGRNVKLVRYSLNDISFLEFISNIVNFEVDCYRSPIEDVFACCHRYIECSNAKKCIHPNKLYSTVCVYRHNLERGRIFYGVNKNV